MILTGAERALFDALMDAEVAISDKKLKAKMAGSMLNARETPSACVSSMRRKLLAHDAIIAGNSLNGFFIPPGDKIKLRGMV